MHLTLTRILQTPTTTLGVLQGVSRTLYSLEDAWKNNQRQISCIPAGTYRCVPHGWEPNSPLKFKQVWRLLDVKGRDAILIHAGNSHKDTLGCILPGLGMQVGPTFAVISDSRMAIELMRREIGPREFMLTIKELVGPTVA